MKVDLLVKDGNIVFHNYTMRGSLGITQGVITLITQNADSISASIIIDAENKYVLPGVIDAHVHLRDPGFTQKEDFETGSRAAAAGGITSLICMPNVNPPVNGMQAFDQVKCIGESKSIVDFGISAQADGGNPGELKQLVESGSASLEIFMSSLDVNTTPLVKIFEQLKGLDTRIGVYCEDRETREYLERKMKSGSTHGLKDYNATLTPYVESTAVAQVLLLCREFDVPVILRQISAKESLELASWAKSLGSKVFVEVNPHHLFLTEADVLKWGPIAKVCPPIRNAEHRKALWEGLQSGLIDFISTDHAPHTQAEKHSGNQSIWKAPSGIGGLETFFPLILNSVNDRKISLEKATELISEKPARIFKLFPKKGCIAVGSDGDLVVVDLNKTNIIDSSRHYTKAKFSPFDGQRITGVIEYTIRRGEILFADGKILPALSKGKFLKIQN